MIMTTTTGSDAADVYALGSNSDETTRLRRQSDELRPQTAELLDRIGLEPGQSAVDLGCGPSGILDLLSAAVSPGGHVVGLDADPAHTALASQYVGELGLANVEVATADARRTGLPPDSFDLVHARTLLVTIPDPAEVVAEMVRLAKPGGWVASQEPDVEHALCYPPLPAWDRLRDVFLASFRRSGADLRVGRRLTSYTGRPGWKTSRSSCTPPRTRPVTRAARCCRTWCAACARSSLTLSCATSRNSPGWTGRSASISPTRAR